MKEIKVSRDRVEGLTRFQQPGAQRRVEIKVSLLDGSWYTRCVLIPADTPAEKISEVAVKNACDELTREKIEAAGVELYYIPPPEEGYDMVRGEKAAENFARLLRGFGFDAYADLYQVHIPLSQPTRANVHEPTMWADQKRRTICLQFLTKGKRTLHARITGAQPTRKRKVRR